MKMIQVPICFDEPKFTQNPKNNLTTWVHIIMIPSAQAYKYLHLNCDRVQANLEWINLSITKHQERPTRTGFVGQRSERAEMSFVISVNTFE